jgi:hypothetical protein
MGAINEFLRPYAEVKHCDEEGYWLARRSEDADLAVWVWIEQHDHPEECTPEVATPLAFISCACSAVKAAGPRFSSIERRGCRGLSSKVHAAMTYTLARLAPGSYDVLLDGMVIASPVRSGNTSSAT